MSMFLRAVCLSVITLMSKSSDPNKDIEVQFLPVEGVGHDNEDGTAHNVGRGGHGALPLKQFMRILPMDIPAHAHVRVIHMGPGMGGSDGGIGDQIINSILSELSAGFHSDVKPLMNDVHAASRSQVHPCEADIAKHCEADHDHGHKHMSNLHCLGLHASDISQDCAKEVQQSLPFICSSEISRYCSATQTIETSVLQCLEEKMEKRYRLGSDCQDSIAATRAVVTKMKTQNVALVDRRTGEVIRSAGTLVGKSFMIGTYIAIFLILAIVLYAFWIRDDETGFLKSLQRTIRELRTRLMGKKARSSGKSTPTTEMQSGYPR